MPIRQANAEWKGNLQQGQGRFHGESGALDGVFSFGTRFEEMKGTNPEELIGAAHAGCFSMALAHSLSQAGHPPEHIRTTAKVHLDKTPKGFAITSIDLETEATVLGIDEKLFKQKAEETKAACPVSKALAAIPIHLQARLVPSGA